MSERLAVTPSQTVGPFFAIGLPWPEGPNAAAEDEPGALVVAGVLTDGEGHGIPDAVIETWQPDADGAFAERPGFRGFARVATRDDGSWAIRTVKPGRLAGPGGPDSAPAAPHIDVSVFCRGLLHRCVTRIYFADEEAANREDAVLASVPVDRRDTLLATPTDDGYRFDIHLQGHGETVFFDV
ncbi:Protocatechuate 3,4-dioxygenase alpha chain [Baekduia alba]|uniref:protocatechuate 3,4-dioxygenase subunit alpha n=1 Tax=Baekduia alba TaxID=2997333 RepID=UPI00233F8E60|nr:protocatechuate 3,4-dioxygenase subunit alpha [Baekduia alba]WCB94418.1 Protocatechuate 3,4-dioxygenase alpha chain [Baekduia alba]